MGSDSQRDKVREQLDAVLRESFYRPQEEAETEPSPPAKKANKKAKPDHYDVICISLYQEDLRELDEKVDALKARGLRKMNRSALIRWALAQVDVADIPRGW